MKLPALPSFIGKRNHRKEVFLSLLLYPDAVEAAIWEVGSRGKAVVLGAVTQDLTHDSWQERRIAADKCITTLENIAQTTSIQKVILGFPAPYLTKDGDIIREIKPQVKKLTHELGLVAIGFVSIYQAIVYKYKKQEGVPPSLILLGFTAGAITVSLYRVGNFVAQTTIPKEGSIAEHLEDAFAQFSSTAVLPSRIVLYGTKPETLERAKRDLMKHHWTARSNFIHFPKIEILPGDAAAVAVSFAGAGEITHTVDDMDDQEPQEKDSSLGMPLDEEELRSDDAEEVEERVAEEEKHEAVDEAHDAEDEEELNKHANVIPVDPKALGFKAEEEFAQESGKKRSSHRRTTIHIPNVFRIAKHRLRFPVRGKRGVFAVLFILVPLSILLFGGYYIADTILPRATVTITTIPQVVKVSETIGIDAEGRKVAGITIAGRKKEQSETGQKTIATTGKKTLGEPAKGTVTILNKSTVPKTYKKGTTISTGGIDFTLDTDVSIASASETFQGITYAKENVAVTAKQIGTKGNIAAGKEFTIAGVSSTVASARNDQAFSGGSSKDVTVVARADQEQIVKELTQELTVKAKEGFERAGEEVIIPETIKTTITQKVFSAEIGEEAKDLNGKITVTISGIGYKSSDIANALREKVKERVPQGYMLSSDLPTIETGSPKIAKDGAITLSATISATAIPNLDIPTIAKDIAGKSVSQAEEKMRSYPGVQDVKFSISSLLNKDRLPKRLKNISVLVSMGE